MGLEDTETDSLLNKSTSSLDDNNNEESVDVTQEKGHSVGTKSLNTFYSFVFIINQIYGPGVLAIPVVFQEAGWIPTTIVLAIFLIVSCFSSTLLCEALSLIPGNKKFDKHIEYTGAVKHYFGHKGYVICQVLMNLCMQVYNIASIVVCAQSLDQFMLYVCGKTWAIELLPHPHFLTVTNLDVLYSSSAICISLGYLVITVFCLPAGFLNLEDNVKVVQLGSFVVLVVLMVEFCGQFFTMRLHLDQVPAVGTDYSQLVSIFIFSWAYVMFVPSWVNEKKDDVSTNKVIWSCGAASFVGYMAIGLLAALVVPTSGSDDLLKNLGTKAYPVITIIASYIFSLGVIAPGIPVCCITTRYNLYIGKVCGKKWSYFWGVIAPWLIGFIFSQKQYYNAFVNWSSLIINGVVNFLIPLLLYYKAVSVSPQVLSDPSSSINSAEDGQQQQQQQQYSSSNNSQQNIYKNSYRNIHKEESTQYIASLTMAPSTVEPWPLFMKKNAKRWTIVFFVITTILVAAQIVVTTYETIAGEIHQHHNHTALNMTQH